MSPNQATRNSNHARNPWSDKQEQHLRQLGILPWDQTENYERFFHTIGEWSFRQSSQKVIEVGKIFQLDNSEY